ncbi:hypothetical protein CCACVL1_18017 [Corchorus capsularis]|uniref:PGG domain-containing protein n=1 Tax=Corchorus capsularis TaxID=210143 RepID=A0A1R3HNT2_COCAP|nr:hypothetical protein CCACVL1_18017 [Corchorus capsularis]
MNPELYEAAATGDLNFLNRKDPKFDVFQVTEQQHNTVLHIAVKFKQLEFCKKILFSNSSSFSSSSSSSLLLNYTSFSSLLLKSNSKGETPFHVAAKIGCSEIAQLFVDCVKLKQLRGDIIESWGVNSLEQVLRMVNLEKDTALHVAVKNGHFAVAKCFVEADSGLLGLVNGANASPLCLAMEGGFSRIASFFLENFPNSLDFADIDIKAALRSAIIHSQHDILKLILKRKPESRGETDEIGWTPLHYAALYGDLKTTQLLLQGNSKAAFIFDQDGTSALHVAAFRGHINVVELLVQSCPDLHEVTDNKGRTLLHVAVISGQEKMVRYILGMPRLIGIINEKDKDGNTALHLAVIYKRDKIIAILAQNRGMERAAMNNDMFTAYDIFSHQPRKLSFLVAKIHYRLRGTHGLPALQDWVNTNLKKEMIGETTDQKDRNFLFTGRKEDEMNNNSANPDEIEKTRSRLEIHLLIAMLIATVTFQAAFTMPGGYKDDGTPQFMQKSAFKSFIIFNSIAFIFSIATVFIQFATSKFSYYLRSRYSRLAEVMIFFAVLGMLLAFASGMYVALASSIGLSLVAYILVACFLLIYYACWFVDPISMHIPGLQQPRKRVEMKTLSTKALMRLPMKVVKSLRSIRAKKTLSRDELVPGDHIFSDRKSSLYYHHGHSLNRYNYVSNIGKWYKFSGPGPCIILESESADKVVEKAYDLLRKQSFGKYNVLFNNCEDLAFSCKSQLSEGQISLLRKDLAVEANKAYKGSFSLKLQLTLRNWIAINAMRFLIAYGTSTVNCYDRTFAKFEFYLFVNHECDFELVNKRFVRYWSRKAIMM